MKRPKQTRVDQGTDFAWEFKKFYSAEGIEGYSTMNETKAAFAQPIIRSLKKIMYRHMEDFGYKNIQILPHFIATMNFSTNRSIDMNPNHVMNPELVSTLYSQPVREYNKPKIGIGDRTRISKYDLPFKKVYKPQFRQKIFEIVAIATEKHETWNKQEEVIGGKFFERIESFEYGFVYNRIGVQRILVALSKQCTEFIYKFLARASEFGWTMGGRNFRNLIPINVPKHYRGEIYVLSWQIIQNNRGSFSLTWTVFLLNWHCGRYEDTHKEKKQPERHLYYNLS